MSRRYRDRNTTTFNSAQALWETASLPDDPEDDEEPGMYVDDFDEPDDGTDNCIWR